MTVREQSGREVLEIVHRALRGLDRREWGDYRAAFADRLHLDYSSWRPDSIGWWTADDWVARVGGGFINDCDATQHSVSNPLISQDGDHVVLECEVRAMHVLETQWLELGGTYTWRFARAGDAPGDGRWLADGLALAIRWRLGNPDLPALAAARTAGA
nr:hypothetical protein GCM10010200_081410 [Actinomadura rugatobispora]